MTVHAALAAPVAAGTQLAESEKLPVLGADSNVTVPVGAAAAEVLWSVTVAVQLVGDPVEADVGVQLRVVDVGLLAATADAGAAAATPQTTARISSLDRALLSTAESHLDDVLMHEPVVATGVQQAVGGVIGLRRSYAVIAGRQLLVLGHDHAVAAVAR